MAETDIASVFSEILPHIEVSTSARLISLYPGETVKLPEVLEEQSANIAHAPYEAVIVNDLTLLKLRNPKVEWPGHVPGLTRQLQAFKPGVVVLIP